MEAFEGTVVAVTHDRWFARGFDRYQVFGEDGRVYETTEPVWDEGQREARSVRSQKRTGMPMSVLREMSSLRRNE